MRILAMSSEMFVVGISLANSTLPITWELQHLGKPVLNLHDKTFEQGVS